MSIRWSVLTVLGVMGCALPGPENDLATREGGLGAAVLPDILSVVPNHLQIQNEHQREMLRLTNGLYNIGPGHLQVRGTHDESTGITTATQEILDADGNIVATNPSGVFEFHPEHNHWHQDAVADFVLRAGSADGPVVAASYKVTFCLIDFDKSASVKKNNERVYWECNGDLQGISAGWIDEYHQSTEGQELDITGTPAGIYYLVVTADPTNKWVESDETNNASWTKIRLVRHGANAKIEVLDHSPCVNDDHCGNTANK